MKGILYIQRNLKGKLIPKPEGIAGDLIYMDSAAFVTDSDGKTVATLLNAKIDDIVPAGVHLSGSQDNLEGGLIYQQWWFGSAE